jgi:hypothetical protein
LIFLFVALLFYYAIAAECTVNERYSLHTDGPEFKIRVEAMEYAGLIGEILFTLSVEIP